MTPEFASVPPCRRFERAESRSDPTRDPFSRYYNIKLNISLHNELLAISDSGPFWKGVKGLAGTHALVKALAVRYHQESPPLERMQGRTGWQSGSPASGEHSPLR